MKWTLLPIVMCFASNAFAGEPLRILALGDSYTIGESVKDTERWPVLLAAKLRPNGPVPQVSIIAKTGWTTANLQRALDAVKPRGPFDLVTLLIGVNNQFQGRDEKEYREQFVDLLTRSLALTGKNAKRVVVVSIPDYGVTPFVEAQNREAVGKAIDRFNAINKEESERAGVFYVDITPASRDAHKDPSLIATDGLHPSAKMYAQWADAVYKALKDELKK